MSIFDHELTETEIVGGVTLEQVADLLPKGLFIDSGQRFVLPANTSPALAASTARCAFGSPVDFAGLNSLSQPVYKRRPEPDQSPV